MWYFFSPWSDPYKNLAVEDQLLNSVGAGERILLFYKNDPCVVLGRFQNPWRELNMPELGKIHLVRRQSGGGTVYHDRGNLCFSFISGGRDHQKDLNNSFLIEALKRFHINAYCSGRSDLILDIEGQTYKFSGSAFKQKKNASFHHGTLLFDSNLQNLNGILDSPFDVVKTKAIASNPAKVINLKQVSPEIDESQFMDELVKVMGEYYQCDMMERVFEFENQNYLNFLKGTDWILGETPEFELALPHSYWHIKKLQIVHVELDDTFSIHMKTELQSRLINRKLLKRDLEKTFLELDQLFEQEEIDRLKEEMSALFY